ncbi:MAG TPA: Ig-like domain-containing protein, partial [Gemmatimonadales bacterium]|nr:Ig-like domain-containing protein [Gemmatimonadales bacterium]
FTGTTNASGLATFVTLGISGPAGSYTLNFVVPNRDDISGSPPSSAINLTAGSASRLVFTTQPSNLVAGGTITPAVRVGIQDALGNPVTSATNQVTVAFGANPGGASLGGTKTVAAVAGVATFSTLTVDKPGNGYTLQASAAGLSGATSSQFNVSTGSAANIAAVSATTLSGTAGSPVTPVPSVKVTDGAGNPVPGVSVTFAVTAGGGSVSGESQTTNVSGIATVGSWVLGTTAGSGNNQLRATSTGLSGSPVTFTASAAAGSAGKLIFITQPASSGQSGVALNPQPALQLVDANNNPVTQGGVGVTAGFAGGPGGSLTGASVNTNSQGRATFSSLTITGPSGTYQLSFEADNVTGVTSNDIVIGSGAATRLDFATAPSLAVQSGVDFPVQPVVRLEDNSGNPVGTSGVTVTVTTQSCSGKSLSGNNSVETNSAGEAVFTDLRLTGTVGNCTLLFGAAGLSGLSTGPIAVSPGAPSATTSSLTVDPSAVTAGSPATVTISVQDASGNAVSGVNVGLTTDADGTFGSSSIVTGAGGTASTSYTPNTTGPHNLEAAVGAFTETAQLTVTAGAVSGATSSLTVASPSAFVAGNGTTVTVVARDAANNVVPGATVTLQLIPSGGFTIDQNPRTTDAAGMAAFGVTVTHAEVKTVSATIGATTVAETDEITVSAAAPDAAQSSVVAESPRAPDEASPVTVTVRDQFGNPVAGITVTLSESGGGGSIVQPVAATDPSGVTTGSFSATLPASYVIEADVGGVAVAQTAAIVVQ